MLHRFKIRISIWDLTPFEIGILGFQDPAPPPPYTPLLLKTFLYGNGDTAYTSSSS